MEKVDHLATVLLKDNNGRGPDIIGLAEVETQSRSVEALRDRLNQGLPANVRKYQYIQSRDPEGGRAIMTAVLSRIPLNGVRTVLWGKRLRILKTEVENPIPGKKTPLILVVSHWTNDNFRRWSTLGAYVPASMPCATVNLTPKGL